MYAIILRRYNQETYWRFPACLGEQDPWVVNTTEVLNKNFIVNNSAAISSLVNPIYIAANVSEYSEGP